MHVCAHVCVCVLTVKGTLSVTIFVHIFVVDILRNPKTTQVEVGKNVTFLCEYSLPSGNPYHLKPSWFMNGEKIDPSLSEDKDFSATVRSNDTSSLLSLTKYTIGLNASKISCGFETHFSFAGKILSEDAVVILSVPGEYTVVSVFIWQEFTYDRHTYVCVGDGMRMVGGLFAGWGWGV